jgi:gluconate kinase
MIYVLFGPPGVGKTYLGQLISRHFDVPFFDADTLYGADEMRLLQEGAYAQDDRDRFITKLIKQVDALINGGDQDLILAEAFTKEKNRIDFIKHFGDKVNYLIVDVPREIAQDRARRRFRDSNHTINDVAFDLIWDEFEKPEFKHLRIDNAIKDDQDLIHQFVSLVKWEDKNK